MNKTQSILLIFLLIFSHLTLVAQEENLLIESDIETSSEIEEELDSALVLPDAFTTAMDSLVYFYYAQHAREGDCKKGLNIEYSDSIYQLRLESLPNEIEMRYNIQVKNIIKMYVERRREHVEKILGLSKYYFPIFEDILSENGLPLEFKMLPVIESALNTTAISRAGAGGLWQFMPSTGRMYGLKVNSLVDERSDPIKSTYAAAHYLKDLYRIYKDWHLAIAAYNCGPGTVNRAIRRSGGKRSFWKIYNYLPRETRSYVPIFIAANYVMNYYEDHNLCPVEIDMPLYTDTVEIDQRLHFSKVSKVLDLEEEQIKVLNPQFRKSIIPGTRMRKYLLRLPTHYASKFVEMKDSIYSVADADSLAKVIEAEEKAIQKRNKRVVHRVRRGDTLSGIAERYHVRVSDIKRWNGLRSSRIKAGQRLTIRR